MATSRSTRDAGRGDEGVLGLRNDDITRPESYKYWPPFIGYPRRLKIRAVEVQPPAASALQSATDQVRTLRLFPTKIKLNAVDETAAAIILY